MIAKKMLCYSLTMCLANSCYGQDVGSDNEVFRILKQGKSAEVFRHGRTSREKENTSDWGITREQEFIDVSDRPASQLLLQEWVDIGVSYEVIVLRMNELELEDGTMLEADNLPLLKRIELK